MSLRHQIARLLPARYGLPLRYYYRRIRAIDSDDMDRLRPYVRQGSTVVDVGANVGHYTYFFVRAGAGHVHAIEPVPGPRRILEAWNHPKVTIHPVACGETTGTLTLQIPYDGHELRPSRASAVPHAGRHETIIVPSITLDSLTLTNVSVVKIDVEGFEDSVLRGAEGLLCRERPALYVEIEEQHRTTPMRVAMELLASLGYDRIPYPGENHLFLHSSP